jgi:hypothetical protein
MTISRLVVKAASGLPAPHHEKDLIGGASLLAAPS